MYKSRLHQWGLDKKKKEHEMLEVIRIGLKRKDIERESVFQIRGRPVTLGDALHYFNRKGIKDPQMLLDASPEPSSPSDVSCQTPSDTLSHDITTVDTGDEQSFDDDEFDVEEIVKNAEPSWNLDVSLANLNFATRRLLELRDSLQRAGLDAGVPLKLLSVETGIPRELTSPLEYRYMEAMLTQTRNHFSSIFTSRNLSVNSSTWSATSDDGLSDQFYFEMYHGYSYLYDGQSDVAFQNFDQAFGLIRNLLAEQHVGFLIYIYDLVIRYEGSGQQVLLLRLLQFLSEMARTVFSENHPIQLISSWMIEAVSIRSALAEFTLRRILDFFQDSIGYFHQETIAVLQTFAWALMNREQYVEAAGRFQQLVDAFETTHGKESYEACYALRTTAESYFYQGCYGKSLEVLNEALQRSKRLPREQEREIYARCLRGMAEISNKLGQVDEAEATMQHVVDSCKEAFGQDHPFTVRAKMHKKSLRQEGWPEKSSIPPMVHRLGRGGNAAKYVWTSKNQSHLLEV